MISQCVLYIYFGEGSKVAAGSVVLDEVPPFTTVACVPARVVGQQKGAQASRQMDQYVAFAERVPGASK